MVIVPPIVSNVEMAWEHEGYRRVLERMGQYVRVIAFDKRGIGMSDRFDEAPNNEHRINDFLAVLDAEDIDRAHISGISEGGTMAQVFAAEYPDRVDRLVISNTSSPRTHRHRFAELAGDHLQSADTFMQKWAEVIEHWGQPSSPIVDWVMPSMAGDESYRLWEARFERQTATQAGFRRQLDSLAFLDTSGIPERISAPTLITHTVGDQVLNVGHARVLAELIPNSSLIEFPGDDHFYWFAPNWRDILDAQLGFVTGGPVGPVVQRLFATVLFTDVVGSTAAAAKVGDEQWRETMDAHDRVAARVIGDHSGRIVKSTGDGLLATFAGPSSAVGAASALRAELAQLGLRIRAGIHAGEIETRDDDISGFAVNLAARVEGAAPDGEVYVTSTVGDLLIGGSFEFEDAGGHELKGIDGVWMLRRLV
jgi:class 3 adenylate cyclase